MRSELKSAADVDWAMVLRAGEHPLAEAGERARYRRHADIAENFPAFYSLPAQSPLSETAF